MKDSPEKRVRPTTRQSTERTQHSRKADRDHSTTRYGRDEWRSPYPLNRGMTQRQIAQAFAACLAAVVAGVLLIDLFGWAIGRFQKGWW